MTDTNQTKAPAKGARTKNSARKTKADKLLALLSRPDGATLAALMNASGWQAHSVRGFLAGTLKKKLGHAVVSERVGDERVYRVPASEA